MPVRLHVDMPLAHGLEVTLPAEAARHAQVLRLQPGDPLTLFNGDGPEWQAEMTRMGRHDAHARVGTQLPPADHEMTVNVTLAVGMPANERMDTLIEKATELGAAVISPLHCARSVLKLSGERADKRRAHWQAVAIAAAEQSGRTRVPRVSPVTRLDDWLTALAPAAAAPSAGRYVLSFAPDAVAVATVPHAAGGITLLSGPEGGLDAREEGLARAHGFTPLSLGPRVLRADTAPLAALAYLGLRG